MNTIKTLAICALAFMTSSVAAQEDTKSKTADVQKKYSYRVVKENKYTPVKDQAKSGTCWCYAGTSFLESEALRKGKKELDLSEMFSVYHQYRLKAEKYVRMHGQSRFSPGGQASDVMDVYRLYGAVPQEVYEGLTDDELVNDHGDLHRELRQFLDTLIKKRKIRGDWREAFDGILKRYLGCPPEEFVYQGKKYTPRSFADKMIGLNMDENVYLVSWKSEPAYKKTVLEVPDNWTWEKYWNVPLDDMIKCIDTALERGYTVAWSSDMSESYFSTPLGMAYVPKDDKWKLEDGPCEEKVIDEDLRQWAYDTYRTVDDHAMHIVGTATDDAGTKYYIIKNSWGTDPGYKGMYYISEAFMRYKTICLIINRGGMPEDVMAKLSE
ncbi:MAG: aminopeptidase [Flavobacteriales bacterium]|nr:aminopeptidase [Flavobacteriales bacterium]